MDHGHQHFHQMMHRQVAGRDVTTINGQVVSVVYVTETPTFDGVIGGYSTITDGDGAAQATNAASVAAPSAGTGSVNTDSIPEAATAPALPSGLQSTSASLRETASISDTAVAGPAFTSSSDSSNSTSGSSSSSGDEGMSTGAKAGLAIGIIAGIGLIAALLLFIIGKKKKQRKEQESRTTEDEKKTFGASRNAIGLQSSPSFSSGPAPRLSIRPISKNLLGDFGFGGTNRKSAGNVLNTVSETPARNESPAPQSRGQTPPENPFADPQNPFADPEKGMGISGAAPGPNSRSAPPPSGSGPRNPDPMAGPPAMAPPAAPNPDRIAFTGSWPAAPSGYEPGREAPRDMPENSHRDVPTSALSPVSVSDDLPIMGAPTPQIPMPSPSASSSMGSAGVTATAGAAAAIASAAAAPASTRKPERRAEPPRPEPQQVSREEPRHQQVERSEAPREAPREVMPSPGPAPSPALTAAASEDPKSPAPGATNGAAASQPGGNVYRVLMDFVPSMDDELELTSGTLVRLLHEYDDGWALCIKLDRSKQGVVPRTCLAAKPSKPKPSHLNQYARNGPQGRPMSPAGGRNSPAMNRPMSPGMDRPMSPGMGRPMSPAGGRGPGPRNGPPGGRGPHRPMSPGGFNQAPRPLSPGPLRGGPKRSQSPGPYGAAGPLPMPSAPMRRRSNSASAFQERRMSPPGPSKLGPGQGMRPESPAGMGMAL